MGLADKRHYVSFIDDALEGYGGQLTPYGEHEPRWFGIRLKRDDLFAAFPAFAPPVPEEPASDVGGEPKRVSKKRAAAALAIAALYPTGFPLGMTEKERLKALNEWLKDKGHGLVSLSTMNRAARRH